MCFCAQSVWVHPKEMADATLFLSSPLSSYMTVSKYKQPISFLANATVGVLPYTVMVELWSC